MSAVSDIEARLRRLGGRRRNQRAKDEELVEEIRAAVEDARQEGVPMTRVAKALGLDRTQLYKTYLR